MFKVIDWDKGKVLQEYESESKAKRECRKLGCYSTKGHGFAPVAFVTDGQKVFGRWCVYYNPRFKTATSNQIKGYL
jgi:hypothetical protein